RHTRFSRDWSSDVCSSDLSIALDEDALLAHFDLNGARLPGAVSLLDLGRLPARERNSILRLSGAVRLPKVLEKTRLVGFGQHGFFPEFLLHACSLKLFDQKGRWQSELVCKLNHTALSHVLPPRP